MHRFDKLSIRVAAKELDHASISKSSVKRVWNIYRSVFYSTVLSDPTFLPVTCFDFPLRRGSAL
jgi:hypothetical protein